MIVALERAWVFSATEWVSGIKLYIKKIYINKEKKILKLEEVFNSNRPHNKTF